SGTQQRRAAWCAIERGGDGPESPALHVYRMAYVDELTRDFVGRSLAGRCLALALVLALNGPRVILSLFSPGRGQKSWRWRVQVLIAAFCLLLIVLYGAFLFATALLSLYEWLEAIGWVASGPPSSGSPPPRRWCRPCATDCAPPSCCWSAWRTTSAWGPP